MWYHFVLLATAFSGAAPPQHAAILVEPHCGSYCLYLALKALDLPVGDLVELEEKLGPPSATGYSMGQLIEAAELYGAKSLPVRTSFENLRIRPQQFACIAHIRGDHFVVFGGLTDGRSVVVYDPPKRLSIIPWDVMNTQWDGTALLLARGPLLREEDLPRPWPWRWIIGAVGGAIIVGTAHVLWRRRGAARQEEAAA